MIQAGIEVMFVGAARHGAVKNHYPRRMRVDHGAVGIIVEDTGKGVLCDFSVNKHTVRMYAPKWELRKIKRKVKT